MFKSMGYAIYSIEKDDYLGEIRDFGQAVLKVWVATPEHAQLFTKFTQAYRLAQDFGPGFVVCSVFDIGRQVVARFPDEGQQQPGSSLTQEELSNVEYIR
jgi:hypothetical protein